jgi:hypothetical protein
VSECWLFRTIQSTMRRTIILVCKEQIEAKNHQARHDVSCLTFSLDFPGVARLGRGRLERSLKIRVGKQLDEVFAA